MSQYLPQITLLIYMSVSFGISMKSENILTKIDAFERVIVINILLWWGGFYG